MSPRKRDVVRGIDAAACVRALATRFEPRAYALIEQVANGTGFKANRWADVIAMSLWPSRGLTVHGCEIKISRGDWQRELAEPAKSAEIQSYCDHWWIVAPDGLIESHELPKTWGLLGVLANGKTVVRVPAPALDAKLLDRSFVAAVLRKYAESHARIVQRERADARAEGAQNGAGEMARRLERAEEQNRKLYARLDEFRDASGIDVMHAWDLPSIGKTVEVLRKRGADIAEDMRRDAERYRRVAEQLETGATEIAAVLPPKAEAAE